MCTKRPGPDSSTATAEVSKGWATIFIVVCLAIVFGTLYYLINEETSHAQHFADECAAHPNGVLVKYDGAWACVDDKQFLMRDDHHEEKK